MSPTNQDLDAALLAAAAALPTHFADSDELAIEPLTAIQATTLSLPGGAYGIESVLKNAGNVGSVILIVTGLVDHATGEVFDRNEARTLWTAALTETLAPLKESLGDFSEGQIHMTDAFDVLDKADECSVVGLFKGQTLAAMLLTLPAKATGQGAAAQLAAAIAQAEAEAEAEAEASEAQAAGEGTDTAEVEDDLSQAAEDSGAPEGDAGAGAPAAGGAGPAGVDPAVLAAGLAAGLADPAAMGAGVPNAVYVPPPPREPRGPADAPVMTLAPLTGPFTYSIDPRRIDLLRDVMMGVSVELGRTRMPVHQILGLIPGSIIELDRSAGAPVDVMINGKLIAYGEVVVVDEEFAVRISEIVSPETSGQVSA